MGISIHKTLLATVAAAGMSTAAHAALVVENFDYGPTGGDLNSFGSAGSGWADGWDGHANPNYSPTANLTYDATGYNNADNSASTGAGIRGGSNAADVAWRRLAQPVTDGTVWLSYLIKSNGGRAVFFLNSSTAGSHRDFLDLDSGTFKSTINGLSQNIQEGVATTATHLVLARITMSSTGDDTLDVWLDPDLTGGEAGLGAAHTRTGDLTNAADPNITTPGFQIIGLSFATGSSGVVDAIRIATGADGFAAVTAVPEPASLALIGLGSALMLRRRND